MDAEQTNNSETVRGCPGHRESVDSKCGNSVKFWGLGYAMPASFFHDESQALALRDTNLKNEINMLKRCFYLSTLLWCHLAIPSLHSDFDKHLDSTLQNQQPFIASIISDARTAAQISNQQEQKDQRWNSWKKNLKAEVGMCLWTSILPLNLHDSLISLLESQLFGWSC